MLIEDLHKFANDLRKVGIEAVVREGSPIYAIINIGYIDFSLFGMMNLIN